MRKIKEKKKTFGSKLAGNKESRTEKEENDRKLLEKLEMIEIRKNIWRTYRDRGKEVRLEE